MGKLMMANALLVPGDFDVDGDVDGADFLVWQQELGTTTTASDLAEWTANFGMPTSFSTAVPEPAAGALLMLAGLLLQGMRNVRRVG